MVMKFKEFKKLVIKPREKEVFLAYYFFRKISVLISYFIIRFLPFLTSNDITTISLIISIIGLFFFSLQSSLFWIIGSLMFILFHVLDCVDGEVARGKNESSFGGLLYDGLIHNYVNGFLFFWMSIGLYKLTNNLLFLYLGGIATISALMITIMELFLNKLSEERSFKIIDFKLMKKAGASIKTFILSFFGILGFSVVLLVVSLADYSLGIYYGKEFYLVRLVTFILAGLFTTFVHLNFLWKFIRRIYKGEKK